MGLDKCGSQVYLLGCFLLLLDKFATFSKQLLPNVSFLVSFFSGHYQKKVKKEFACSRTKDSVFFITLSYIPFESYKSVISMQVKFQKFWLEHRGK